MKVENLLDGLPDDLPDEMFTTLHQAKGLRIERIVSTAQASLPGLWYDQDEHEWVILLQGGAAVEFEGDPEPVQLRPLSYLNIPAHARHRVVSTDPSEKTVWLAIFSRD